MSESEKLFEFQWRHTAPEMRWDEETKTLTPTGAEPHVYTSRNVGKTEEEAWANLLTNDGGEVVSSKEITQEMLDAELAVVRKMEDGVIERYAQKLKYFEHLLNHPAVAAHLQFTRDEMFGTGPFETKCHEDQFSEASGVPNHADLAPYLSQLRHDREYMGYDPENVPTHTSNEPFERYSKRVGLHVNFEGHLPGEEDLEYGRIWLVEDPKTGERGLLIEYGGCEMSSGTYYLLIPKET